MKKSIVAAALVALAAILAYTQRGAPPPAAAEPGAAARGPSTAGRPPAAGSSSVVDSLSVAAAFAGHAREVRVSGQGRVVKILADDREGSRHQRFILRVDSGPTVLIAHNIDLARRVAPLQVGDVVSFAGEYIWNAKGGVVHWTHRDPSGRREAGWLQRGGETFQ